MYRSRIGMRESLCSPEERSESGESSAPRTRFAPPGYVFCHGPHKKRRPGFPERRFS